MAVNVGLAGELLFYAGIIIFVCTVLTVPLMKGIASFFRWLFWGKTHYDRPQPALGPAKAMRMQNNLPEAMDYLEALINEYPDLAVGYIEMMDIYAMDLKDQEKTTSIYNRGKANVRGRGERQKLDDAYKFYMTD